MMDGPGAGAAGRADGSQSWEVWRQDDAGHKYLVSSDLSREEADLMVAAFEHAGHKQMYWVHHSEPVLDPAWLQRALDACPGWPHPGARVVEAVRIGSEHGFGGRTYRVVTDAGTLVFKRETAEQVDRALKVHHLLEESLEQAIPRCYGGWTEADHGVIFLEDVSPAVQGDVLVDPGEERARAAVAVLARLHSATWDRAAPDLPRWRAEPWDASRWHARLAVARERYPGYLKSGRFDRLPDHLPQAIDALHGGPATCIHGDAHLDNFLWRPDGNAVLLDWSTASVGPPGVDVARFLVEGADVAGAYEEELMRHGLSAADVMATLPHAMLVLAQGVVGWAGRPEAEPLPPRMAALREHALRGVCARLASGA